MDELLLQGQQAVPIKSEDPAGSLSVDVLQEGKSAAASDEDQLLSATRLSEVGNSFFIPSSSPDARPDTENSLERMYNILQQTKGTEVHTHTNTAVISLLFQEHSHGWKVVAEAHVHAVHEKCEACLGWVVDKILEDHPAFAELRPIMKAQQIQPFMRDRLARAKEELDILERDRNRPMRTMNMMFRELSEASRENETWRIVAQAIDGGEQSALNEDFWLKPNRSAADLRLDVEIDRQKPDIAQAIVDMLIYNKIARERFIDEVLIHVNGRHLLDGIKKVFTGLSRMDKASMDKIWKSERQKFEQLQLKLKQLSAEKATLTDLGDALWAA